MRECDKTKETSPTFSFVTQRMIGGGRLLLPEILGQIDTPPSKTAISYRFSFVALQPSENKFNYY